MKNVLLVGGSGYFTKLLMEHLSDVNFIVISRKKQSRDAKNTILLDDLHYLDEITVEGNIDTLLHIASIDELSNRDIYVKQSFIKTLIHFRKRHKISSSFYFSHQGEFSERFKQEGFITQELGHVFIKSSPFYKLLIYFARTKIPKNLYEKKIVYVDKMELLEVLKSIFWDASDLVLPHKEETLKQLFLNLSGASVKRELLPTFLSQNVMKYRIEEDTYLYYKLFMKD
jgi:hypothetical protein